MSKSLLFYNFIFIPISKVIIRLLALTNNKICIGWFERQGSIERITERLRGDTRCRYWFHVSSAGEFLQAKPVIERIKKDNPRVVVILTFFSPSGIKWGKNFIYADVVDYFYFDDRTSVNKLLSAINPKILILVKYDIWPNLVTIAKKRGHKVFLISATIGSYSLRTRSFLARSFYRPIYMSIDKILAVSDCDSELFLKTAPMHKGVEAIGDTRVDSVLITQKKHEKTPCDSSLELFRNFFDTVFIVGSSWARDEKVVFPAWNKVKKIGYKSILMIVVPHEPTLANIEATKQRLDLEGLSYCKLTDIIKEGEINSKEKLQKFDVLIADVLGKLSEIYRVGNFAYVGSGRGGVHNVLEPVAWNLPVIFGSFYQNSREAEELLKISAGFTENDHNLLADRMINWIDDSQLPKKIGKIGKDYLTRSSGASSRCAFAIMDIDK